MEHNIPINNRYDQHLHTNFSYDADPDCTAAGVAEAAIKTGLAGITITDHFDPLWPDEKDPSYIDLTAYEKALTDAETAYAGRLDFLKGIELGLTPGECLKICADAVAAFPYDFVLAGIHASATTPVDYPAFVKGRSLEAVIGEYYTLLLDSIKAYKNYDVLSHLNNIDRYTDSFAPEEVYMPYVDEILRVAVSDGKGIEINTSSFRYGIENRGTPPPAVLKRFKELGGEIITIGSDAHAAKDVGADIADGEELLKAAGFRYVAVFKNREPVFLPL